TLGVALDGKIWKHDGTAWSQLVLTPSPPLRYESAIAFDGTRILLYGGQGNTSALADFWAFDGVKWTQLSANAAPGLRRGHAMAYDSARNRLVLSGGTDMNGKFPTDTWEWDGTKWQQFSYGVGQRVWHKMAFDPVRKKVVMTGGAFNPVFYTDTQEWDGVTWVPTIGAGGPDRALGAMVWDSVTQRVLALGGTRKSGGYAGIHAYDPKAAAWIEVQSTIPGSGTVFGAAFDRKRGRTVISSDDVFGPTLGWYFHDGGPGTYTPFGGGCMGNKTAIPVLEAAAGSSPIRGATFGAQVSNVSGATAALLLTGFSNTAWGAVSLPLKVAGMNGCELLVSPDLMAVLPVNLQSGVAAFSVPIPSTIKTGLTYYQQAITLDPQASNGLGAMSNGSIAIIR
ncbi:MAG: hypothetical protein KDC95_19655, partial [Planctomycetes bacterium]|nr:hypothetical protein [Planctomycetota bacterium]